MVKSKAPLPFTMYLIESEVFSLRTKTPNSVEQPALTLAEISKVTNKKDRDLAAVKLAATCVRIIEEVE
jgi:hypothetical protein